MSSPPPLPPWCPPSPPPSALLPPLFTACGMASPPPADVDPSAASRLSLRGRRALVTGGHRGIGAAVVLGLAAAGAHVAVIDRGGAAARSSDIPSRVRGYGVEFYATAADLADVDATVAAVGRVQAEFGAIDILVNITCLSRPS